MASPIGNYSYAMLSNIVRNIPVSATIQAVKNLLPTNLLSYKPHQSSFYFSLLSCLYLPQMGI